MFIDFHRTKTESNNTNIIYKRISHFKFKIKKEIQNGFKFSRNSFKTLFEDENFKKNIYEDRKYELLKNC